MALKVGVHGLRRGAGPVVCPVVPVPCGGCVRTVFQCSQLEEEAHGAARDKLRSCEPTRGLGRREKGGKIGDQGGQLEAPGGSGHLARGKVAWGDDGLAVLDGS